MQEWGIRGQVRALSFNAESELYPSLSEIHFEDNSPEPLVLEQAKRHGRFWLLKLKGYENPESSRELRGKVFGLPRDLMPPPEEGEIYLSDLVGLEVRDTQDRKVGEVLGFLQVGENDVMRVGREEGEEALIPYHSQFIAQTSFAEKILRLTELAEDLLQLP